MRLFFRNGLLEEFLKNDFLHDPQLRYGLNSQKTLDALISVCESEGIKTSKFLPIPPNAGRSIETPPVSDFQTIRFFKSMLNSSIDIIEFRSAFLHHLKGDEFKKCWKLSFSLYKQNREEFQDFVVNLKSEKAI